MKYQPLFRTALCLALCIGVTNSFSQTSEETLSPCLVSSLNLSTGYNPQTTSYYSTGDTDPRWKVAYISPDLYADASGLVPLGSGAKLVWEHPMWSQSSQCRFISALSNSSFTTQPAKIYRTYLERTFQVCTADTFAFQFNYAADDTLALYIDGIYQFQTAAAHISNSGQLTLPLAAGTHTVRGVLMNGDLGNPGYYGARIGTTVTSASGRNTLISEGNPCGDYVCKPAGIEDRNTHQNFSLEAIPNPVSGAFAKLRFSLPATAKEGHMRVIALDGRMLFEKIVTGEKGVIDIPVSDWPKGIYRAVLSVDGSRQTTQLLIH